MWVDLGLFFQIKFKSSNEHWGVYIITQSYKIQPVSSDVIIVNISTSKIDYLR